MKRIICILALFCVLATAGRAATPEQMEQARVATIKVCLRNMNDGSGYLDSINPKSLSALEAKLRKTEKSNIEALKAIPLPEQSEYAAWDKAKFKDFWTNTFVNKTSGIKQLSYCRGKVQTAVGGIDVTVTEAAEETPDEQTEEIKEEEEKQEEAAPATAQPAAPAQAQPDKQAPADEESADNNDENSNTGAIIVLCILVVVVILLVGYALNVMKKNKERQQPAASRIREEEEEMPRHREPRSPRREPRRENTEDYAPAAATVLNDPEEESPFAAYSAPLQEDYTPRRAPREEERTDPRDEEIERLRSEIAALKARLDSPRPRAVQQPVARRRSPSVIYLSQANAAGVFTRADARYVPGASIFKLVTTDGVSGSYSVIEDAEVYDLALTMPADFLANACLGRNLLNPGSAQSIINETSGTAIFENGRWRVSRKAQVRYSY